MGLLKVYKDKANSTWYWQCNVQLCVNSAWGGSQREALREGLRHLDAHCRVGFGRR